MSKKAEYLKQMGWTQELIEHFMVEDFDEDHSYGAEDQGTVCCTWEKTAFEEGLKVGIRLMMEVYSL